MKRRKFREQTVRKASKPPEQERVLQTDRAAPERTLLILLPIAAVLRLLIVLFPGALPRVWGWDFGLYISDGLFVPLLMAAPLVLLVPSLMRKCGALWERIDGGAKRTAGVVLLLVLVAALAVSAWHLPVRSALLGDGRLCLSEVLRLDKDPASSTFFLKPSTWLTGVVLHAIVGHVNFETLYEPFAWLSGLSLAVTIASLAFFLRKERLSVVVLVSGAVLTCAGTLFFFRYVELYHLQYAFVSAFLLSAWHYYRHDGSRWPPVVLLAVAIMLGLSSVVLLPALVLLLTDGRRRNGSARNATIAAICMAAAFIVAFALRESDAGVFLKEYVTPLSTESIVNDGMFEGSTSYTLFSIGRLADVVNALALNTGIWWLVPVLLLHQRVWKNVRRRPSFGFFSMAALGAFLLVFGGNARYGLAQDWDIPAAVLLAIPFLAAEIIVSSGANFSRRMGSLLPALLVFMAGHVVAWIGVNASSRSADRFSDLADMYSGVVLPWNSYRSYENLRQHYLGEKDAASEFDAGVRGVRTGVMKRDGYRLLMRIAGENQDTAQSRHMWKTTLDELLRESETSHPPDDFRHVPKDRLAETVVAAMILANRAGHGTPVASMLSGFDRSFSNWSSLGVYYSFMRGDLDAATKADIMRRSLTPATEEPLLAFMAGSTFSRAGSYDAAIAYFERTLALAPCEYSKAFVMLAEIYHDVYRDKEKALATLKRYRESCEFRPDEKEIEEVIEKYERGL